MEIYPCFNFSFYSLNSRFVNGTCLAYGARLGPAHCTLQQKETWNEIKFRNFLIFCTYLVYTSEPGYIQMFESFGCRYDRNEILQRPSVLLSLQVCIWQNSGGNVENIEVIMYLNTGLCLFDWVQNLAMIIFPSFESSSLFFVYN